MGAFGNNGRPKTGVMRTVDRRPRLVHVIHNHACIRCSVVDPPWRELRDGRCPGDPFWWDPDEEGSSDG